jgi:hypothetical protein
MVLLKLVQLRGEVKLSLRFTRHLLLNDFENSIPVLGISEVTDRKAEDKLARIETMRLLFPMPAKAHKPEPLHARTSLCQTTA